MATIQEFMNFEFIVAEIKEVKEHPDADKLYVLQVDTGSGMKQLVAGIRKSYTPDQLVGKRIIMINNLDPAVIRGQESQGMLLAASAEHGPVLLTPDGNVPLGAKVR